jgi:hypothetical protein
MDGVLATFLAVSIRTPAAANGQICMGTLLKLLLGTVWSMVGLGKLVRWHIIMMINSQRAGQYSEMEWCLLAAVCPSLLQTAMAGRTLAASAMSTAVSVQEN